MEKEKLTRQEMYRLAWNGWGEQLQYMVAVEELAELQKAILKFRRFSPADFDLEWEMMEEIVDVEIMLEQIKQWRNYDQGMLDTIKDRKLVRLAERLGCIYEQHE